VLAARSSRSAVAVPCVSTRLSGEALITYPRTLIGESYDELIAFVTLRASSAEERSSRSDDVNSVVGLVACGLASPFSSHTGNAPGRRTP